MRHCVRVSPRGPNNIRVTSQQHVPCVVCKWRRQEMFLLSPRNIFVSLATNFVVRYKVSGCGRPAIVLIMENPFNLKFYGFSLCGVQITLFSYILKVLLYLGHLETRFRKFFLLNVSPSQGLKLLKQLRPWPVACVQPQTLLW